MYIPHDWVETGKEILTGYAALAVWNSFLEALPDPRPEDRWYGFLWRFLHLIGMNISKLRRPNGGSTASA